MISAMGRVRALGRARLRGSASARVVADYHPSKPVGARHFPTDLLPLASVKASFAACGKRSWAYALSEGEAGDEREELIAYNACGVCLCAHSGGH